MFVSYLRSIITSKFKLKINSNVKLKLYKHTLNLEHKSYNSYDKTEILQRITEDADVYSSFFQNQLVTSNLSYNSEMLIKNAIGEVTKNKISIIIAHRLETTKLCNKVITMKDGVIV